ncbi:hypothetical protein Tcan_00777, partial [Toxocara canis]
MNVSSIYEPCTFFVTHCSFRIRNSLQNVATQITSQVTIQLLINHKVPKSNEQPSPLLHIDHVQLFSSSVKEQYHWSRPFIQLAITFQQMGCRSERDGKRHLHLHKEMRNF